MARGQGVNPFGIPTNAQPMDEKGGSVTIPWRLFFTRLAQSVANLILSAVPGAPNKSIQFNDGGAFGGDAHLTWDKVNRQQEIIGESASALRTTTSGAGNVTLHPASPLYNDVTLGMTVDDTGNYIPDGILAGYLFQSTASDEVGLEVQDGLTPGSPLSFATGQGVAVTGATATAPHAVEAYQYGGLGTGAVPGMILFADRNDSGSGAAGMLGGQLKDGRFFVIWMDATGAMRYNVGATLAAIRPTESGSVSDTSGFLFGSGSGSTTNITQLFTRRGEEGRSGIPGLPGPPGATGSTGATGAAGQTITKRTDEGPTRVMVIGSTGGGSGSGITALTGDVTATGPGSSVATIANSAVTLAKIANAAANSKLVGSGATGSGSPYAELTLGTNLSMSGTTLNATPATAAGSLLGVQVITATGAGTYTPTAGTTSVIIELQGGGAGGGGAVGSPTTGAAGQGGGGGGWLRVRLTTAFSGAGYVVGAKGTGATAGNNPGNAGSNTTFTATGGGGTVYTASGGTAGGGGGATASFNAGSVVTGGGCTNGDQQQPGGASYGALIATANNVLGSTGGISHYSNGSQPVRFNAANSTAAGNAATGKGGGGSGGASVGTGAAAAGGDGSDGIIVIWEYS